MSPSGSREGEVFLEADGSEITSSEKACMVFGIVCIVVSEFFFLWFGVMENLIEGK
jgi:hypothetical protein